MANIYTKDDETLSNKVFLLNGNSITHSLETEGIVNPLPSLRLVDTINTTINKRISDVEGLSNILSVSINVSEGKTKDILSVYNIKQGEREVGQIDIPKTQYSANQSDTIALCVGDYKISADVVDSSISIRHLNNALTDEIFFKKEHGDQNVFVPVEFNSIICANYENIIDKNGIKLSDIVDVENDFGSMYNGIVNIINECELKDIDFTIDKPIISAFNTINKIALNEKIDVPEAVLENIEVAKVSDGFNSLQKIVRDAKYEGHRNLDRELKKIDERFDINERSIGAHTKEISELKEKINTLESRLKDIEDILRDKDIFVK